MLDKMLVYLVFTTRFWVIFWLLTLDDAGIGRWVDAGFAGFDLNYALNTIVTPVSEARGPYRQGGVTLARHCIESLCNRT